MDSTVRSRWLRRVNINNISLIESRSKEGLTEEKGDRSIRSKGDCSSPNPDIPFSDEIAEPETSTSQLEQEIAALRRENAQLQQEKQIITQQYRELEREKKY